MLIMTITILNQAFFHKKSKTELEIQSMQITCFSQPLILSVRNT